MQESSFQLTTIHTEACKAFSEHLYVPGSTLGCLNMLSRPILITVLRYYYSLHFTGGETGVQSGTISCPKIYQQTQESGAGVQLTVKPHFPPSRAWAVGGDVRSREEISCSWDVGVDDFYMDAVLGVWVFLFLLS